MKLLFDENLSPRLPGLLADLYPDSVHVRTPGLQAVTDTVIWNYAKTHGFLIVSKDKDFRARSDLYGHPPKVVWLRLGNCPVHTVETLLRRHSISLHTFNLNPAQSHLILP